jgi:hypothetical protein
MPVPSSADRARARLLAAGIPETDLPALLERAAQLVAGLEQLTDLDPELPEPALIWRPIDVGVGDRGSPTPRSEVNR